LAGMPRFYFDIHDGDDFIPDHEGIDLEGVEDAKVEAVNTLPDMARDGLPEGDSRDFVVTVRDETDRPVWRVRLSLVIEPLA
jgi:hypothetical protein